MPSKRLPIEGVSKARTRKPSKPRAPRKSVARHYTPPPDILHAGDDSHLKTPSRCFIIAAKLLSQELETPIPQDTIRKLFGVSKRSQTRILKSKQLRTFHNRDDDNGPDPRGRKRAITRQDTAAIADYLDDDSVPLDDRGTPWQTVVKEAGV
jgi:hypothetical protein